MMIWRIKQLQERGDTIVEVLVALTVLGSVITASYGATTHNYASLRDSQERTTALKIVEQQAEMLRTLAQTDPATVFTTTFGASASCLAYDSGSSSIDVQTNPTNCIVANDGSTIVSASTEPHYVISMTKQAIDPSDPNKLPGYASLAINGSYADSDVKFVNFKVSWDSSDSVGQSQTTLVYGVYRQ